MLSFDIPSSVIRYHCNIFTLVPIAPTRLLSPYYDDAIFIRPDRSSTSEPSVVRLELRPLLLPRSVLLVW